MAQSLKDILNELGGDEQNTVSNNVAIHPQKHGCFFKRFNWGKQKITSSQSELEVRDVMPSIGLQRQIFQVLLQ